MWLSRRYMDSPLTIDERKLGGNVFDFEVSGFL